MQFGWLPFHLMDRAWPRPLMITLSDCGMAHPMHPSQKQKGHSHSVLTAAFSPDGSRLALGFEDCIVRLWDAISCMPIAKLEGHSGQVYKVSFSSDGHTLISRALGEIFAWDLTSRSPRRLPSGSHPATSGPPASSTLPIWSLHDLWVQVERQEDHQVRRICYIPPHYARNTFFVASSQQTHSRIVVGCEDGRVIILAIPGNPFNGDLSNHESLPAHDTRLTQRHRRGLRGAIGHVRSLSSWM